MSTQQIVFSSLKKLGKNNFWKNRDYVVQLFILFAIFDFKNHSIIHLPLESISVSACFILSELLYNCAACSCLYISNSFLKDFLEQYHIYFDFPSSTNMTTSIFSIITYIPRIVVQCAILKCSCGNIPILYFVVVQ